MLRRKLIVLLAALAQAACGRTSGRDAGVTSRQDGGDLPSIEDGSPGPADRSVDLERSSDADRAPDSRSSADVAGRPARFACSALAPLAARGSLSALTTNQVLFADDRSVVVLQAKSAVADQGHDVLLLRLPDGDITSIATRVHGTEWLVPGASLLVKTVDKDLVVVPLDGAGTRVLARGSYEHTLSPDGKRLFSFGECQAPPCALDVIDIATGTSTRVSHRAALPGRRGKNVVISPNARFWAFTEESAGDAALSKPVLQLVDESGQDYALSSQPGVSHPTFVSDDLLIFLSPTQAAGFPGPADLRGHVPGSGDRSTLIATGHEYDPLSGYDLSRDGRWILGAKSADVNDRTPTELTAIPLYGGQPRVLANDLFPTWTVSMYIDAAGFVGDEHVVYVRTAGSPSSFNLTTVPLAGGVPRGLGVAHDFVASPLGDLVAFPMLGSVGGGLRVADLGSQREICQLTGSGVTELTFLPDARGLVFGAYTNAGSGRLVYLSLADCNQVELAKLDVDRVDGTNGPSPGFGRVDPTSCFAVVQSNAPDNAGTSLVVLPP